MALDKYQVLDLNCSLQFTYQDGGDPYQLPPHFDALLERKVLFRVDGTPNSNESAFDKNQTVVHVVGEEDEKNFTVKAFTEDGDIISQYNNIVSAIKHWSNCRPFILKFLINQTNILMLYLTL